MALTENVFNGFNSLGPLEEFGIPANLQIRKLTFLKKNWTLEMNQKYDLKLQDMCVAHKKFQGE